MKPTLLVIDDERNIRRTLRMVLEGEGYRVLDAERAEDGLAILDGDTPVDLVVLDVRLPGISGLEALEAIRARAGMSQLPVVVVSGHATVSEAVQAVQVGATDFLEKPLDRDRVLVTIRNALERWALVREVERLRTRASGGGAILGRSPAMQALFGQLEKVAPTQGRVLITGESGTGKELVARALHDLGPRRDQPFIKVNCAAIPSELIESELFGFERGAFTGAQERRRGLFELADRGTLFLDEIGDMSAPAQAKVLRALQSGEITRVGAERPIAVDVRVVAATHRDLEAEVAAGRFREDLFFRLNVLPLRMPPLRDRREDIPVLVAAFLTEFARDHGVGEKTITPDALDALARRSWAGNVRELRNVVERMVILGGDPISAEDIAEDRRGALGADDEPSRDGRWPTLRARRDQAERAYILEALEETSWNISRAAVLLGVERTNLHKKMRAFGLRRDGDES